MKSKAPLVLMEQIIMLLVFALAAAICLQAFIKADALSSASANRDKAVIWLNPQRSLSAAMRAI